MNATPEQLIDTALAGDPAPLAEAFARSQPLRAPLMRSLLASPLDAPVAACFALIWRQITGDLSDPMMGALRWYLRSEAASPHPLRAAVQRETLARVLMLDHLPPTEDGFDLGFAAVRTASDARAPLGLHALADRFLRRLTDRWLGQTGLPLRPTSLYAAVGTVNLGVLQQLIDHAPDDPRPPDLQKAMDWALGTLIDFAGIDPWLAKVIRHEFDRDPASPAAIHRRVQLGLREGEAFRELAPLFHAMRLDPQDTHLKLALQFGFDHAQDADLDDVTAFLRTQLQSLDPGWTSAPPRASRIAGSARLHVADATEVSPLRTVQDLLRAALDLAEADLTLGSPGDGPALRAASAAIAAAIPLAPVPPGWGPANFVQSAETLVTLDRREFFWIAHYIDAPHAKGHLHYGSVDLARIPALHDGLLAIALAFCQAGFARVAAGHDFAPTWTLARLVQIQTLACQDDDALTAALALLDRVAAQDLLTDLVAIERDNCRLRLGAIAAARAATPPGRAGSEVVAMLPRDRWSLAEGVQWTPLVTDPAVHGTFDIAWPDGRVQAFAHDTPARTIATTRLPGVSYVAEGMLVGPAGTLLRPDPYHTSFDYPRESSVVVAGQGRAIRIRPQADIRCDTPVLLFEAFEAMFWPNYYHWMIPLLARVSLALDLGLFDGGRKLVVPARLRPWMRETLDLIGLPQDLRIEAPFAHRMRFDDAQIVSSIEHVSPAAVQSLRRRLVGPVAASGAPPADGPCLYLSRRRQRLRKMVNETQIEDMARDMGFEVIAPEDHTVAEQVRIFSVARGIAAPEGAALTNTLFCAPGTRVLSILCLNDMMPVFTDLSFALGHAHRKLPGLGIDQALGGNRFQPQYAVEPEVVRASLAWVQAQGRAGERAA